MARNTSLFLRIGEAKNLPVKDLVSGTSDPYCVIKVDNEEIARTATVWKSLTPFWGEEFMLHLPCGFHRVSIYVYDEDIVGEDDLIGSVQLTRDIITCDPKGIEMWFPLCKVEKDQEVQGEIHLEVTKFAYNDRYVLNVNVIEARDLAAKDLTGASDPYVVLSVLDKKVQTQTVRGSLYPTWNEAIELEVARKEEDMSLNVTVWDWDRVGDDDFMGQVEFKLDDLKHGVCFNDWFRLMPRDDSKEKSNEEKEDFGTIRIRGRLTEERILPSEYYQPLLKVLMDSVSPEVHKVTGPTPLKMLQEVMTLDLIELASTLVKLYLGQGKVTAYLDVICTEEIRSTSNPNTLFRGNSLATKSMDQFMKLVGMPYLHDTLNGIIKQIFSEKKACELDPGRVGWVRRHHSLALWPRHKGDKAVIQESTSVLLNYLTAIKESILNSIPKMPPVMRLVFKTLKQRIEEQWPGPEQEDRKYVGISGFLFLRFLAPAILSPKLFSMQVNHPDAATSRTLTLLAKVVQSMGNLGLQIGQGKEEWMEPLHPFIRGSVSEIKVFIDQLTDIEEETVVNDSTRRRSIFHPNITVKQGYLYKVKWRSHTQSHGQDKITNIRRSTFKKRFFWLKFEQLIYAKKPTDQVRTTMLTQQICGVERVDKVAFKKPNVGQVILKDLRGNTEILYIMAKDINDLHSWISSIRKTVITNSSLIDNYHPGIYKQNKWTCCFKPDVDASGCSRTHAQAVLGDWRDPLDPDMEAQTIFSQLLHGRHILRQKYMETTEEVNQSLSQIDYMPDGDLGTNKIITNSLTVSNDTAETLKKSTSFQDAQLGSVAQLLDVINDLEKAHEAFDKMEKEEKKVVPRGSEVGVHRPYAGLLTARNTTDSASKVQNIGDKRRQVSAGFLEAPDWDDNYETSAEDTIDLDCYEENQQT